MKSSKHHSDKLSLITDKIQSDKKKIKKSWYEFAIKIHQGSKFYISMFGKVRALDILSRNDSVSQLSQPVIITQKMIKKWVFRTNFVCFFSFKRILRPTDKKDSNRAPEDLQPCTCDWTTICYQWCGNRRNKMMKHTTFYSYTLLYVLPINSIWFDHFCFSILNHWLLTHIFDSMFNLQYLIRVNQSNPY